MTKRFAIAIPARYNSTRFPGKPLAKIAGKTMVQRVLEIAQKAAEPYGNQIDIFVTTEDKRVSDHVKQELGANCISTPPSCKTGSDRVLSALRQLSEWPDFIINLQGDAPFTPPTVVQDIIEGFNLAPKAEVITPVYRLSWQELDSLRNAKTLTPFSGTIAVVNERGRALWFSKNIIPALRDETKLREISPYSPVLQHVGLYGFRTDVLERFCGLPEGVYEKLEGLEQLRMIENDIRINAVEIQIEHGAIQSGVDSPEDVRRAEKYFAKYGEFT
ncbi:MAG: 3-deoxy-manno-octulosonate cytidylyltransferase [Alphaproteobacteria bacterium]|nr:3-deoxy-manno-octulosonate cytidylyltransferase [Alphaproteobacteria bacterium]